MPAFAPGFVIASQMVSDASKDLGWRLLMADPDALHDFLRACLAGAPQ